MKLTIALTYLCQSKCSYCQIWRRYQENPNDLQLELEEHDFLLLFRALRSSVLWIEFTGGEPFLRNDAATIISAAFNETDVFAVGVTSNGLAGERVLEQVSHILECIGKKQLVVGISIDGKHELYERARGLDGFGKAIQTYLRLKRMARYHRNMRPHIAYTINQYNAGHFLDFYMFMAEEYGVGIDDISFSVQHNFGYYFQKHDSLVDSSADSFRKAALTDISDILKIKRRSKLRFASPIRLFYGYYLENIANYFANPEEQVIPCKACDFSAYIDPYGQVYPCSMWDYPIGNLRQKGFERVWYSDKRLNAAKSITQNKCPNCWTPCEAQPSWIANLSVFRSFHL